MTQREHDDPIDALKAELAAVSPSPEFQSRVRQRIAGDLDLLRDELAAVAPSPEFAVRVRQGVAEADAAREARLSWSSGWRWIVPVGAVAAGVIAVIALTKSGADVPEHITVQAPIETATQAPTTIETQKPVVAPLATSNDERRPSTGSGRPEALEGRTTNVGRRVPNARAQVVTAAPPTADPMLEVITNQPAVLRAMWVRAGAAQAVVAPGDTSLPENAGDIVIAPVEVNPVVVRWLVEPPGTPGVLPFIRRVAADMAERSAK